MLHKSFDTIPKRTYLRVQSFVEIAPLVKRLFRETYGVDDDELYRNDELRERIRNSVKSLRASYQNNVCVTDYNTEENRKAYMIAYYPYFVAPAAYVAKTCIKPNISATDGNWAFFAGGPCPEMLGVAQAVTHPVRFVTLDLEANWFPYQKMTRKFCEEFFSVKSGLTFYHGFNIGDTLPNGSNCREAVVINANLFFMQNYLSHLSPTTDNINKFMRWFSAWAAVAKDGALFAFVDLNYGSTATVFDVLGDENFLRANGLAIINAHIPAFGDPLTIHHDETTQAINDNIFTGEQGLQKRFLTKFYFVVLQKKNNIAVNSMTQRELEELIEKALRRRGKSTLAVVDRKALLKLIEESKN